MLNKVMVIGNLGADPEARYTANGTMVCEFRVAASDRFTDRAGQRQERTEWFRVITYQRLAEICSQYLQKGRQVYVEGRLQTRSWDGQDGQKHYVTELIANTVQFLGGQGGAGGPGGRAESFDPGMPVGADGGGDIDPDDLPF
jgi:single-strand DNA-binding protein